MDWMKVNKLKLNPDKMEVLLVGVSPDRLEGHFAALNGVTPPQGKGPQPGGAPGPQSNFGSPDGLGGQRRLPSAAEIIPAAALPGRVESHDSYTRTGNISYRLLQCALRGAAFEDGPACLLYTSPSPRD